MSAGYAPNAECTYYSLGGPFLEDFRLIHEHFPEIRLVSIESDEATYSRQKFHRFCKRIQLVLSRVENFLEKEFVPGARDIIWLDFTDFRVSHFSTLESLLPKLGDGSLVRVTLPVNPPLAPNYFAYLSKVERAQRLNIKRDEFDRRFSEYLVKGWEDHLENDSSMSALIARMLENVCGKVALSDNLSARLVSAHRYADGQSMMTASIVIMRDAGLAKLVAFKPMQQEKIAACLLDMPLLSVKERLKLAESLPQSKPSGKLLSKRLGYLIDRDSVKSERSMEQYSRYHRHYPLFGRIDL